MKYKSQATLVARLEKQYKAQLCIRITDHCYKAEGYIWFDKISSSVTPVYVSESDMYCK